MSETEHRSSCAALWCSKTNSAATVTAFGGTGGQRGPALDEVATRLTKEELVRQVIQGGGNMPAYGKKLSPAEVEALVSFMATLHSTAPVHPSSNPQNNLPRDVALSRPALMRDALTWNRPLPPRSLPGH